MRTFCKIGLPLTCGAAMCGAAFFWQEHKSHKAAEQKVVEAARDIRVRAEQGDAKAQYDLARMYYKGEGAPQDYAEAARWSRKAAEQGDAKAQYSLGYMYHEGRGVPRDYTEAVRWLRKAAEQGVAEAQYGLGNSYRQGEGVPRDDAEAVRWYRKAAEQGEANAQYALRSLQRGTPRPQWIPIIVLSLALLIAIVPRRRWGRARWLRWALCSALCTALLLYELLLSALGLPLLARGPLAAPWRGVVRVLLLALLACGSAIFTFASVRFTVREWKSGGDRHQPQAPPAGTP